MFYYTLPRLFLKIFYAFLSRDDDNPLNTRLIQNHRVNWTDVYNTHNIATNDCTKKTSCELLKELRDLFDNIQELLPDSETIISLPIVRWDNAVANQIVKNLCLKIKEVDYKFLDNSNLTFSHLGQKGLDRSNHGTKKMVLNIISLIKRL